MVAVISSDSSFISYWRSDGFLFLSDVLFMLSHSKPILFRRSSDPICVCLMASDVFSNTLKNFSFGAGWSIGVCAFMPLSMGHPISFYYLSP